MIQALRRVAPAETAIWEVYARSGRMVGHLEKARISRIKIARSGIGPGTEDPSANRLRDGRSLRAVFASAVLPPQFSYVPHSGVCGAGAAPTALLPPPVALLHRKDSHERFHSVDLAVVDLK